MHHSAFVNCEKFVQKHVKDLIGKKVLDVGSYDVNGTLKPIFEGSEYVGLDMEKGPNVDVVSDAHSIPFVDEYFDIVVSSSCFEHDDMFWVTFLEMCRVLKKGGLLYVQAPANGPYHGWPGDNWRFYEDSWKALEKWGKTQGQEIILIDSYIDRETPDPYQQRIWDDSVGIYKKREDTKIDLRLKDLEIGHLKTTYRGVKAYKSPFDYVMYQMIINEIKPDLVIEIGTYDGGGALYIADLMEIIGHGEIHTIDIDDRVIDTNVIHHKRIKRFLEGYQNYDTSQTISYEKVLVIDDGSHRSKDVYDAFTIFKSVVSVDSYYIIEDGILSELGYDIDYDGGPLRIMNKILSENNNFEVDYKWCDFYGKNVTFNPLGFLKRIS